MRPKTAAGKSADGSGNGNGSGSGSGSGSGNGSGSGSGDSNKNGPTCIEDLSNGKSFAKVRVDMIDIGDIGDGDKESDGERSTKESGRGVSTGRGDIGGKKEAGSIQGSIQGSIRDEEEEEDPTSFLNDLLHMTNMPDVLQRPVPDMPQVQTRGGQGLTKDKHEPVSQDIDGYGSGIEVQQEEGMLCYRCRSIRIDILSTWGDPSYVGLCGVEV